MAPLVERRGGESMMKNVQGLCVVYGVGDLIACLPVNVCHSKTGLGGVFLL